MGSWLKLHRCLITSSIFDNPNLLKFWIWVLCKASHQDHIQRVGMQEVSLTKGQFIFGRISASEQLKMTQSMIYRFLKKIETEKMIEVKTNNKFSIITVVNWGTYQDREVEDEQQMNNKRTTNEQQMNTNKNGKNGKNVKKKDIGEFTPPSLQEVNSYIIEKELSVDGNKFLNYFTESGWVDSNGKQVKNWRLKLQTWDSYQSKDKKIITLPNRLLTPQEQIKAAKDKYFIK